MNCFNNQKLLCDLLKITLAPGKGRVGGGRGGGCAEGGTLQSFVRGGSAPRSNTLPFCTYLRTLHHFSNEDQSTVLRTGEHQALPEDKLTKKQVSSIHFPFMLYLNDRFSWHSYTSTYNTPTLLYPYRPKTSVLSGGASPYWPL